MSDSTEIAIRLHDMFGIPGWKRRSKSGSSATFFTRVFDNENFADKVTVYSKDGRHQIVRNKNILFGIVAVSGHIAVYVASPDHLKASIRYENIPGVFESIGLIIPSMLSAANEDRSIFSCEESFGIQNVKQALVDAGFTYDGELSQMLKNLFDSRSPVDDDDNEDEDEDEDDDYEYDDYEDEDEDDDYDDYASEIFIRDEPVIYGFGNFDGAGEMSNFLFSFATPKQFASDGHIVDCHITDVLADIGYTLPSDFDEIAENCFVVASPDVTREEVRAKLDALGFVFDDKLDTFLNSID